MTAPLATSSTGRAEYWPGDRRSAAAPKRSTPSCTPARPAAAQRDALRSLRGSILRTEVYALTARPGRTAPTPSPNTPTACAKSSRRPASTDRQRIFFPHSVAQRTTQWERGDDPMTQFAFTDDYDDVGQPRRQVAIACPRGWRTLADTPARAISPRWP